MASPALSQRRPFAITGTTAKRTSLLQASTGVLLLGYIGAVVAANDTTDVDAVFPNAARVITGALAFALFIEGQGGLRFLIRADLFMLLVLFLLTFLEFLFPQATLVAEMTLEGAQTAVSAAAVGFAGITLGRHAFKMRQPPPDTQAVNLTPGQMIGLFFVCFFFGFLHIFLSVNFDIGEAIYQMSRPRFSQPWTRARLGGFAALMNELELLIYLLPPLAGAVFAQARKYNMFHKAIVVTILAFVFYYGLSGGTRNIFMTYVITFAASYTLFQPRLTLLRVVRVAVPTMAVSWFALYYLPELRTVGITEFSQAAERTKAVYVDLNMVNVANITGVFPRMAPFLGFEVPYITFIRPIPRALWPSKPEGLSFSIEEALGVGDNLTLSATFIGEFWMAGGFLAIGIASLLIGVVASAWNRVGMFATTNLQLIYFASGFFAAGICMRSFMSVAPTLLPTLFLYVLMRYRARKKVARQRRAMAA